MAAKLGFESRQSCSYVCPVFAPVLRDTERKKILCPGHFICAYQDYSISSGGGIISYDFSVPSPAPDSKSLHDNYWWMDYPCSGIGNLITLT